MANEDKYTLKVTLDTKTFPELGLPTQLKSFDDMWGQPTVKKDMKKTDGKAEYQSLANALASVADTLSSIRSDAKGVRGTVTQDSVTLEMNYRDGFPTTYKFMGMDVNSDYEAIIRVGDGNVPVMPLFDRGAICSNVDESARAIYNARYDRVDDSVKQTAIDFIQRCSDTVFRKISTSIKTGSVFSAYNDPINSRSKDANSDTISITEDLMKVFTEDIESQLEDESSTVSFQYDSIMLNIITQKATEEAQARTSESTEDMRKTVSTLVVSSLMRYWCSVVEEYNKSHQILAAVDLWNDTYKRLIGENAFNARMIKCQDVVSDDDGSVVERIIPFGGISLDGDIKDADTIRIDAKNAMASLSNVITGNGSGFDARSIMMGNIDTEMFENPYELSFAQLQAVSDYDALQQVDEDASVSIKSYNMDDPDERESFLKSAMKSYERNFKRYKPVAHYDVTEAMADMIENGERFDKKIVPEVTYSENPDDTSVYVVTDSQSRIEINIGKSEFVKAGKLAFKSLNSVLSMFPAKTVTP